MRVISYVAVVKNTEWGSSYEKEKIIKLTRNNRHTEKKKKLII